jgi:hypothetical protein
MFTPHVVIPASSGEGPEVSIDLSDLKKLDSLHGWIGLGRRSVSSRLSGRFWPPLADARGPVICCAFARRFLRYNP